MSRSRTVPVARARILADGVVLNKKETKPLDPARDANRGIFIHNEPDCDMELFMQRD
jgi:hypothetical protein